MESPSFSQQLPTTVLAVRGAPCPADAGALEQPADATRSLDRGGALGAGADGASVTVAGGVFRLARDGRTLVVRGDNSGGEAAVEVAPKA